MDVGICNGRLSAQSAVAIPTSDVSSSTSVFWVPYKGNKLALFDGTGTWSVFKFANISVACPNTSSTPFDVFAYNNAGVVALETATWTNVSSRATGITLQDGVLVKVGATTRRYLGTCCTIATPGNIEDTASRRFVWNYYNRVEKFMFRGDTTDSWTYSTDLWRAANNSLANSVSYVVGVSEDAISAAYNAYTVTAAASAGSVGVGIDSSTSTLAQLQTELQPSGTGLISSRYDGIPSGVGLHVIYAIERVRAAGTVTYFGDNGTASNAAYGLHVKVNA